jgi:exosortase
LLWLVLFRELSVEWSINPQYSFGWGVPFLALYLLWKRWQTRPVPDPPGALTFNRLKPATEAEPSKASGPSYPCEADSRRGHAVARLAFAAIVAALALSLLPIRLVQEANPDWRVTAWALAGAVVGLTLAGAWCAGGVSWLKHFAVPLCFVLLAVPWPTKLEKGLIQGLTRKVTAVTAEGMNWIGIAAQPSGNLIQLANGTVGVSEACSGVRSFQAALMVAVFAGELYRLSLGRRATLVLAGLTGSVVLNVCRTSLLTWICAHHGPDTEAAWHDPAGYGTLALVIIGVWGLGRWWSKVPLHEPEPFWTVPAERSDDGAFGHRRIASRPASLPAAVHDACPVQGLPGSPPHLFPLRLAAACAGWVLVTETAVELWYRRAEDHLQRHPTWSVSWPRIETGLTFQPLPEPMQTILRCDESQSAVWRRPDGTEWKMFFLRWRPGRMAAQLARGHTPDVCLKAGGFELVSDLGSTTIEAGGLALPFQTYIFAAAQRRYFVFFSLVDDRLEFDRDEAARAARTYWEGLQRRQRLEAVRRGQRHRGHQVFEVAMTGYASLEEARRALAAALPDLVQTKKS